MQLTFVSHRLHFSRRPRYVAGAKPKPPKPPKPPAIRGARAYVSVYVSRRLRSFHQPKRKLVMGTLGTVTNPPIVLTGKLFDSAGTPFNVTITLSN